jgi:IclR family transcriptional regulator, acetate operon repressor
VAMPEPRRGSVQSVDRALDVLEALSATGELGVSEVAARTGLVVSTTHRLLAALANRGYVAQNPANGRYLLGFKVLELTGGLEVLTSPLRAAARPHLERVQQATSETTNLVILDGDRVIYVDQVEGSHTVRMFTRVGRSALAHTTGSGKAILTYRPPDVIEKLYPRAREPFQRLTPRTLTTLDALRHDFARIRRRGYALDTEEHEEGVSCVATAVFDSTGFACGAISISGPTARMDGADTRELGRLLHSHAADISAALGYREIPEGARSGAG